MSIAGGANRDIHRFFLHYLEAQRLAQPAGWRDDIAVEIYHRLERLQWLEWQVRTVSLEVSNPTITHDRLRELMLAVPTLTDAWYYLAFRTMRLIKKHCPGLEKFEIVGITLTRNKLLEHDNDVYNVNTGVGGTEGPTVKAPRWDGEPTNWADEGVFVNIDRFTSLLHELLTPTVIAHLQAMAE